MGGGTPAGPAGVAGLRRTSACWGALAVAAVLLAPVALLTYPVGPAAADGAGPAVTGVQPASGPAAGGTTVTITGTGLDGATSVTFAGADATVLDDTADSLEVEAPAGAAGTADVTVVTAAGAGTAPDGYTYIAQVPVQWAQGDPDAGCGSDNWYSATAPDNTTSLQFSLVGGGGGGGSDAAGADGGAGGLVSATVPIAGGAGIATEVGCAGANPSAGDPGSADPGGAGFGHGGASGATDGFGQDTTDGGGGGGASALCLVAGACTDPVAVAAGGGGGGNGADCDGSASAGAGGQGGAGDPVTSGAWTVAPGQDGATGNDGGGGGGGGAGSGGSGGSGAADSVESNTDGYQGQDPPPPANGGTGGSSSHDEYFIWTSGGGGGGAGFTGGGGGGSDFCDVFGYAGNDSGGGGGGASAVQTDAVAPGFTFGSGGNAASGGSVSALWNLSAPQVTGVLPTVGPTGGGTTLTVSGTYLTGATVTVGGTPATPVSDFATSVVVTTPPGPFGAADVQVTTDGGTTDVGPTFIYDYPVVFANTSLPPAVEGTDYSVGLSATGGSSVDVVTLDPASPALPPGLELDTDYTTGRATLSGQPTEPGTYDLVFDATDQRYDMTVTAALPLTVDDVSAAADPATGTAYGATVAYTATIATGGGDPSGSVNFSAQGVPLCTAPVTGGAAGCDATTTPAGQDETVTAAYSGDGTFAPASTGVAVTVAQTGSVVSGRAAPDPADFADPVTYAASVAPAGGTPGTPTGTVSFATGATTLCTAVLAGGSGSCATTDTPLGADQTVSATYSGDGNFTGSQSSVPVSVGPAPQTVVPGPAPVDPVVGGTDDPSAGTSGGGSGNPVVITRDPASAAVCTMSAAGTVTYLHPGTCLLDYNQAGNADYQAAPEVQVPIAVGRATPAVTWATPRAVPYGTVLGRSQLAARSSVRGTFTYSPPAGTVPAAGTDTLSVVFTPTDTVDYTTAAASVPLTVTRAVPRITWALPSTLAFGIPLSGTQLDATASVPGTFTYSPPAGTVPALGALAVTATFDPVDPVDDAAPTVTRSVRVVPARTTTAAVASYSPVQYGSETGDQILLSVDRADGNPEGQAPLGSVTVRSGTLVVCTATLQSDAPFGARASCAPTSATLLGVGTHTLSATYNPVPGFTASRATSPFPLTVQG